jgi:hypothetical protein
LSGGGALSGNVTLTANVTSVFGRTGAVVGVAGDYSAFYVPLTRNVNTGVGLSGGGALSADLTLTGVVFHASGSSHTAGDVPDPGATAGTTRFLCENATWTAPPNTPQTPWAQDVNAATFRLYNASRVIINTSFDDVTNPLQILQTAGNGGAAVYSMSAASANPGARFYCYAGRGSQAAPVALAGGDGIAYFSALGYGTSYVQAALIGIAAEAAFSATSAPAFMAFATTPVGSTTVAERMRITSAGKVLINQSAPPSSAFDYQLQVNAAASGDAISASSNAGYAGIDAFGANASGSTAGGWFNGYGSRGTLAVPSFPVAGDTLVALSANGYGGSGWNSGGYVAWQVGSTWTSTNRETYIIFVNIPSGSISAAERMRISSAGNVGIGTSSPSSNLVVQGAGTGQWPQFQISQTSGATKSAGFFVTTSVGDPTQGGLAIARLGATGWEATLLVVNLANGNVGVNTGTPAVKLGVTGPSGGYTGSGTDGIVHITTGTGAQTDNMVEIGVNDSGQYGWIQAVRPGSTTLSLCLNPGGSNVGIGTNAPNEVLSIIAGNRTTAATANQVAIGESTNNTAYRLNLGFYQQGGATWQGAIQAIAGGAGTPLVINPSGGNVGIGTASPGATLHIKSSGNCLLQLENPNMPWGIQSVTDQSFRITHLGNADVVYIDVSHRVGIQAVPSYVLHVGSDSAAKPSTNTWTVTSDMRTKKNVRRFEGDMNIIRALDPIVAEYNGLAQTPDGARVVSFDTQELKKIIPEAVHVGRGKLRPNDTEDTDIDGMNTHEIFFHMLRAIQMLDARLMALERN